MRSNRRSIATIAFILATVAVCFSLVRSQATRAMPPRVSVLESAAESLAREHIPQRLITLSANLEQKTGNQYPVTFTYERMIPRVGTAPPDIAVVYSNGVQAELVVLRTTQTGIVELIGPTLPSMGGLNASIDLLDLNADDQLEIVVNVSGVRPVQANWVFALVSNELRYIGPSAMREGAEIETPLTNSEYVDLEGDGKFEIVSSTGGNTDDEADVPKVEIYRLGPNGNYSFSFSPLVAFAVERMGKDDRNVVEVSFPALAGTHSLIVSNGAGLLDSRARSARVSVNGVQVVPPCSFAPNIGSIVSGVHLEAFNQISVEIRGRVGRRIYVVVN